MHKLKLSLFVCVSVLLMATTLFAEVNGVLNVVTGEPESKIYIDGQFVSKDYIRNYSLAPGEHYVRIEFDGKLMYAKMLTISAGELKTITSENFVDFKTNVPNRGAMNREARRLQETKGNVGLGVIYGFGFPASGMSLKWQAHPKVGVHLSGMGGLKFGDVTHTQLGARAIIPIGTKVLWNSTFTGYVAPGFAYAKEENALNPATSFTAKRYGVSVGMEWAPFDPVYFSGELGSYYQSKSNGESGLGIGAVVGVHFYF